jgi:PAS domain S-box-containing protein
MKNSQGGKGLAREKRLQIMMSPEELRAVDNIRFHHRMPSRAATVRELLRNGIAGVGAVRENEDIKSRDYGVLRGPIESRTEALRLLSPGPADAELASRDDVEAVLRNTPFLLTRCSSDLRYVIVSEAFAQMLGHRPEELVGKRIIEVIGERAFETILPHVNAVLAGRRVEYEAEVPYKDIGLRFVHVTYAPDKDRFDCVRGWIASITTLTKGRQIEASWST